MMVTTIEDAMEMLGTIRYWGMSTRTGLNPLALLRLERMYYSVTAEQALPPTFEEWMVLYEPVGIGWHRRMMLTQARWRMSIRFWLEQSWPEILGMSIVWGIVAAAYAYRKGKTS